MASDHPTPASTPTEEQSARRRRSLAFLIVVLTVALVSAILELGLGLWNPIGPDAGRNGKAAPLAGLPSSPVVSPTPANPPPVDSPPPGTVTPPPSGRTPPPVPVPSPPPPVGDFRHQNTATVSGGTPVVCTDASSPSACGAVFSVSNARPGTSQTGTVALQANATAPPSTFQLAMGSAIPSPAASPLCADLHLRVVDGETPGRVLYDGNLAGLPTTSLNDNASRSVWPAGSYGSYGFTISLPLGSGNADENSRCTASIRWIQQPA